MTKQERKALLETMIDANENMSPERSHYAHVYADCLITLCNNLEYKNAEAIWRYKIEREGAGDMHEQWCQYISDIEQADPHSEMLYI